jgi:hypothetical protein
MQKHPYFNLNIFTKRELENLLHRSIDTICLLREWPLSSVVEVICKDSSKWIVKTMREPLNIEGAFYQRIQRDFLPICDHIIDFPPDQQILIYQKIDGTHPDLANLTEDQALTLLEQLLAAVQTLNEPGLPARIHIDTPEYFSAQFQKMLNDMGILIETGQFTITNRSTIEFLQDVISDSILIESLTSHSGYAHGDLAADNILLRPDGSFIILDWQRAIYSSPLIDAFLFLDSLGIPPLRHLTPESLLLANLERIEWYVATAIQWNPAITPHIDQYIDAFVHELKLVYPANTSHFKM